MKTPQFTAEVSLYKTSGNYYMGGIFGEPKGFIIPGPTERFPKPVCEPCQLDYYGNCFKVCIDRIDGEAHDIDCLPSKCPPVGPPVPQDMSSAGLIYLIVRILFVVLKANSAATSRTTPAVHLDRAVAIAVPVRRMRCALSTAAAQWEMSSAITAVVPQGKDALPTAAVPREMSSAITAVVPQGKDALPTAAASQEMSAITAVVRGMRVAPPKRFPI